MKDREISGKPRATLSAFPSPFCSAYSPAGCETHPRLHNLKYKQNGEGKEITNFLGT